MVCWTTLWHPTHVLPIILKRDLTTFTYLANKRNLRGLSLHLLQKTWKLHQQSYARRATILKLVTGWM